MWFPSTQRISVVIAIFFQFQSPCPSLLFRSKSGLGQLLHKNFPLCNALPPLPSMSNSGEGHHNVLFHSSFMQRKSSYFWDDITTFISNLLLLIVCVLVVFLRVVHFWLCVLYFSRQWLSIILDIAYERLSVLYFMTRLI